MIIISLFLISSILKSSSLFSSTSASHQFFFNIFTWFLNEHLSTLIISICLFILATLRLDLHSKSRLELILLIHWSIIASIISETIFTVIYNIARWYQLQNCSLETIIKTRKIFNVNSNLSRRWRWRDKIFVLFFLHIDSVLILFCFRQHERIFLFFIKRQYRRVACLLFIFISSTIVELQFTS